MPIYQANHVEAAEHALSDFENGLWGERFPTVPQSWRRNWEHIISFSAFAAPVRKIIYTTNAIESLYSGVRKSIRNKGHFPSDEAATKLSGWRCETSRQNGRIHLSPGQQQRPSLR